MIGARAAEHGAGLNGLGIVHVEVLLHDGGLGAGEADVEMALESDKHAAHAGDGSVGRKKSAAKSVLRGCGAGAQRRKFQEIASLHGFVRASLCD